MLKNMSIFICMMHYINNNKYYKFIPSRIISIDDINKKCLLKNDIYDKYQTNASVEGELIVCGDISQPVFFQKKIIKETYDDYLKIIEKRDILKDKWIYNIIDGISEQDSVIYRDDKCIVIPSYTWDLNDITKLHILCIPIDTKLRTIRSLEFNHIPLLKHMKMVTCAAIKEKYGINECYIKQFFHYEPSTYHLHIHFMDISNTESQSSVEYSHELNNVIFNLFICSDYYKKIIMNKRV